MLKYITKCGCEHNKEDLIKVRVQSESCKPFIRMMCPKHNEILVGRKIICADCGEIVKFGIKGRVARACKACQKKRYNASMRVINRNRKRAAQKHQWCDYCQSSELCEAQGKRNYKTCIRGFFPIFKGVGPVGMAIIA